MQGNKIEAEMHHLTSAIHHKDSGESMVTVFVFFLGNMSFLYIHAQG
jgi:hypothetical protein